MSSSRVTVREAAERLGLTPEAVRKRIERDSIKYERQEDGRLYVFLDDVQDLSRTTVDDVLAAKNERIADLKEQVKYLHQQVSAEQEARLRADHIIARLSESNVELSRTIREREDSEEA